MDGKGFCIVPAHGHPHERRHEWHHKQCGEYQQIVMRSDEYSGRLEKTELPKEVRLLIDRYVSEQNALGSRYGMLAYLLGFFDCKEMLLEKCLPTKAKEAVSES